MEGTPRLINNWQYAEAPSPQAILSTGISQAVAPVNQAVENYIHHQQDIDTMRHQQDYGERLQSLRLDAVSKNVAARDARMLQIAHENDAAKVQAAKISEQARRDADVQIGANQRINALVKQGQEMGLNRFPQMPVHTDGTAPTPAEYADYSNKLQDFVAQHRDKVVGEKAPQYAGLLAERSKILDRLDALDPQTRVQATQAAIGDFPPDKWANTLDPNSSQYKSLTNALDAPGSTPMSAMQASGLTSQWKDFIQSQVPKYQSAFIQKTMPAEGKLLNDRLQDVDNQMKVMFSDGKGSVVSYAPDVISQGFALHAKEVHDDVAKRMVAGGGDAKDAPAAAAAQLHPAAAISRTIAMKAPQLTNYDVPIAPAFMAPNGRGIGSLVQPTGRIPIVPGAADQPLWDYQPPADSPFNWNLSLPNGATNAAPVNGALPNPPTPVPVMAPPAPVVAAPPPATPSGVTGDDVLNSLRLPALPPAAGPSSVDTALQTLMSPYSNMQLQ